MLQNKPETRALIVALVGTLIILTVFLADLLFARHRDSESGERRLQHFGIMMAEHTARAFEGIDVLLREMATDLSTNHRDWDDWAPNKGWEYVAQRHSRAMPQLRDLIIFDRLGEQRFISTYFPPPRINVKDRPYFVAIENGAEASTYGPYVGRNSGRYSYAIAHRISDSQRRFNGVVFAALEPSYLQDFCWSNRLSDDFEAVLINANGLVVASCRPADLSRESPTIGVLVDHALFGGKLAGLIPQTGLNSGNGLLVSVSPVPGFSDLRILTAIPEKTLLANWHSRMIELASLGLLVTAVLIVGGFLIRRQVHEMAALTVELASSRDSLEERITQATVELAGQKDLAERANKAKSRFLAAASHDLRQPLHALSLFAADLQRQVRSGRTQELPRLAEQISTSTSLLGDLLDSLLDISRLDVSGIKPEIRPFELNPIFERLSNSFRRAAVDRHLKLRIRPSKYWLNSDPLMVEQMLANLIANAVRYTPSGGRIVVAARRRGEHIQLEVRDSGIGIPAIHQAEIFAEFYQVDNAAREQSKGLGLGLSIVDRLARALEIKVVLRSQQGEGTLFALLAPRSQPSTQTLLASRQPQLGKVHFVGHSEALLACLKQVEAWSYEVSISDSPSAAQLPRNAVLIVDAELAAGIGAELPAKTPWIVLDGDPSLSEIGAHLMPLPIRPAKLRALLNQLQKTFAKLSP